MQGVGIDHLDKLPRPRVFKTHLAVQFLPDQIWTVKPKIIYLERDVKDVAISCYHHRINVMHEKVDSREEHFEELLTDKHWWGPYREHVLNYKNLPDYENILHWTYEQLISDMEGSIRKMVQFLGKTITDEQLMQLKNYLQFDKMKSE